MMQAAGCCMRDDSDLLLQRENSLAECFRMSTARNLLLRIAGVFSFVIWITVSPLANAFSADCEEEADAFLTNPNGSTFLALSALDKDACWKAIGSSNENLNRLILVVERGSRWAARYLVRHLKKMDGANLEDSLIAVGQFADHHMGQVLNFAKDGELSNGELKDALTMLPLSLNDNAKAQLKVLETRRIKIMKVVRPDLLIQREIALKAIGEFALEIENHIQTVPGEKRGK